MSRLISYMGFSSFGAIFLTISPKFRGNVMDALALGVSNIELYAPWSYVGLAVFLIATFCISLSRGAQAR